MCVWTRWGHVGRTGDKTAPEELNLHFSLAFSPRSQRPCGEECVCVALLLFYASVSLCFHTVTLLYFHTHTRSRHKPPDTLNYSRDSPLRATSRQVHLCSCRRETSPWWNLEFLHKAYPLFSVFTLKCTSIDTHTHTHALSDAPFQYLPLGERNLEVEGSY